MRYALIALVFLTGCELLNQELEARKKYDSRVERTINEMQCYYSEQGVCACVITDFSFQGGTGIGLAIDSSGKSCEKKETEQ